MKEKINTRKVENTKLTKTLFCVLKYTKTVSIKKLNHISNQIENWDFKIKFSQISKDENNQ